ncbi:MAG: hypothetical protein GWN02_08320, partial [Gemmatimonadetes bacterium]|nr:hypothetical protein [Actinomycetota bacterium]NIY08276.1 hypothetical protein [Gemmatimonadota bacterium]NIS30387.1 hypothetical protein [Actinomycetota bacterium]NIT95018.1 hypothetical protein [Actinomycetota bacterium]NIU65617.1 hypothetical protein [Actinomycetota bacterium]
MTIRLRTLVLCALVVSACADEAPDGSSELALPEDQLVRTADPLARGYAETDFPRVQ